MRAKEAILFCLCGPSGSGKSTIARRLVAQLHDIKLSISTTTRAPRSGEEDGRHYYFVSETEFESRVTAGRFLEHAVFNRNRYGTELRNIEGDQLRPTDLLLDIDIQGARELKRVLPSRVVVVFLFPPTGEQLLARFVGRGSEGETAIRSRLAIAEREIHELRSPEMSDYLVVNGELDQAVEQCAAIVAAERLRLARFDVPQLDQLLTIPPYKS